MSLRIQRDSSTRGRRGSGDTVLIAASVCVALLIAGGFFAYRLTVVREAENSHRQAIVAELEAIGAVEHARAARNDAVTTAPPASVSQSADANSYEEASELLDVPVASLPEPEEPVYVTALPDPNRADVAVERRELIVAHLEFGEFERAVQAAKGADDAEERSTLLSLVADAQMKIGDLGAALGSIRTMPRSERPR